MYIEVITGQREIGQYKPVGSVLQTAFFGPTFANRTDEKQQLEMLAGILRRLSDNFVPENFAARNIKDKHPDCLEILLQGNVKALTKFGNHLETVKAKNLLDQEETKACADFLHEEQQRLVQAALLFDGWKRSFAPTSQPAPDSL
jgi:hypothetical protein